MTSGPLDPLSTTPLDPFERDLRSLLRDRAAGPLPVALHHAAEDATMRRTSRAFAWPRRTSMAIGAAAVLLVALGAAPVAPYLEAILGPAASPAVTGSLPSPDRAASASPSASDVPAIDWDAGSTRLTADAVRIVVVGQQFTGQVPGASVRSDDGSATYRTLEVAWQEHGLPMRLHLYLAADQGSWWITEIRTYDGSPGGEWITYHAPAWRLPLGAAFNGDLRMAAPGGSLQVDGARLLAFSPDTLPEELRLCRPAIDPARADMTDPMAQGQPLAGTAILDMTPADAKQLLMGMGLCHTFRYSYQYGDGSSGYSEVWCDAPPAIVTGVSYGSSGEVIVTTEDAQSTLHTPRPQPPVGWGC